jgi:hypothetical protein
MAVARHLKFQEPNGSDVDDGFSVSGFKSHLQKELQCQNLAQSPGQILVFN